MSSQLDRKPIHTNATLRKQPHRYVQAGLYDIDNLKTFGTCERESYPGHITQRMVAEKTDEMSSKYRRRGGKSDTFVTERELLGRKRHAITQKIASGNYTYHADKNRDWKQEYDRYLQHVKRKRRKEDIRHEQACA